MGKWAARLAELTPPSEAEKISTPSLHGTDETDRTPLLAVLAVPPRGVAANFQPDRLADLAAVINRLRRPCDDDENRAALIDECATLDAAAQADLLEHFAQEAALWESLA